VRLVFGGVFDRYPRARVALGHMGETLPSCLAPRQPREALRD